MGRCVQVRLDAPPDEVRERVSQVLAQRAAGGPVLDAEVREDGPTGSILELCASWNVDVPYFGWFVRLLAWVAARAQLRDAIRDVQAGLGGEAAPRRRRSLLVPPALFTAEQATALAAAAAVGVVANFGGALLTQDGDAVTRAFDRSDQALGLALAVTRVGVLVSLVASALADRFGRRRLLLAGLATISVANLVSALAPTFEVFTASQVIVRAATNMTLVVASIVVIEEAPEGARAFALSMYGLAIGLGFGLTVVLLPIADLGRHGWRVSFFVSALALAALPSLARHLRESRRFEALRGRPPPHRGRGLLDRRYGGRLLALGAVAFLTNLFAAPSSQLTNRYLTRTHYYSNADVAALRAVTAGVPGFVGVVLAGRLAETGGRRRVSIVGLVVATLAQMAFFLTGGTLLWLTSTVAIVAGASAALTLGALDVELFPTAARGTSSGVLLVAGVAGSAAGLLAATLLQGPAGGLGPGIAVCGVAPLLAALLFLPRMPEPAARLLDDISPSEA